MTFDVRDREVDPGPADPLFWLVFCSGFTLIALLALVLYRRAIARRRRLLVRLPAREVRPIGDPGVVAFVAMGASRVSGGAPAAIVLDLARKRALEFDLGADGRSRVRRRSNAREGLSEVEHLAISAVADAEGAWTLPWESATRHGLRRLKRAIVRDAVAARFVSNFCNEPILRAAFGTPPWRLRRVVTVVVSATLIAVVIFRPTVDLLVSSLYTVGLLLGMGALAPWELTAEGARLRDSCHAHARWLDEHGQFDDVPAAGVWVWNEHLVSAAATGVAERAIRELTPPGWTRRSSAAQAASRRSK